MFEECQHCLTLVAFKDEGICPACGKSRYVSPIYHRSQILRQQENQERKLERNFWLSTAMKDVLIGGGLVLLGLFISFPSIIKGSPLAVTYGIIILGSLKILRGLISIYKIKSTKK